MDRRKALKNMGLSLGYAVATPTLLSIFQSCKTDPVIEWIPDFLSKEEGTVLKNIVDIILPKTDTPSASEVNVHLFIDKFMDQVLEKEQKDFTKMSMGKFANIALTSSGKKSMEDLSAEDLEPVIAKALSLTKEQEKSNSEAVAEYMTNVKQGKTATLDETIAASAFATNLRGLTIWGYKTSEYIGEEVLAYLPIPGEYKACEDVEELTGGKAWSL